MARSVWPKRAKDECNRNGAGAGDNESARGIQREAGTQKMRRRRIGMKMKTVECACQWWWWCRCRWRWRWLCLRIPIPTEWFAGHLSLWRNYYAFSFASASSKIGQPVIIIRFDSVHFFPVSPSTCINSNKRYFSILDAFRGAQNWNVCVLLNGGERTRPKWLFIFGNDFSFFGSSLPKVFFINEIHLSHSTFQKSGTDAFFPQSKQFRSLFIFK